MEGISDTPGESQPRLEGSTAGIPASAAPQENPSEVGPRPSSSLSREILTLAVPALGALVAEPLFVLIDSAMVGHLGTAQLAGLSLSSTVLQTVVGLFVFLAYSTTALAARALGEGSPQRAVRSGIEAMWLAAGLGIIAAAALILTGPTLLRALGAGPDIEDHAIAYLHTSAPGLVGMFVVLAATGTLRGLLDTRTPLVVAVVGAAFNVAANATFIFGLGWGVAGSGAGTALAQTFMAVVLVWIVVRGARRLGVPLRPSAGGMWGAAVDGAPLLVRTLTLRVALLATVTVATFIGVRALAAHQVVYSVWSFAAYVLDALAIAAQALVGFSVGAGSHDHLRLLLRRLTWWGAGAGLAIGVVLALASPWLPMLFGTDTGMHRMATAALLVAASAMPLAGVVFLLDGVLIGAGQGRYLAVAGVLQLVVYLPALVVLHRWVATLAHEGGGTLAASGELEAMIALWVAYGWIYMAARALTLAWRTWWSPRHALLSSPSSPSSTARHASSGA